MFNRLFKLALILSAALAGCGGGLGKLFGGRADLTPRVAAIPLAVGADTPAPPAAGFDYSALGRVLAGAVDKAGRVDPFRLRSLASDLETQLRLLAEHGPSTTPGRFPDADARTAYWLNARAAWSLRLWLASGCPAHMARGKLLGQRFRLDGAPRALAGIDRQLYDEGGWPAVVTAPGIALDRAAIPLRPFSPVGLREELFRRLDAFIDDEDRFVVDIERRRVLVPPVLWRFREEIIRTHERHYHATGSTLLEALLPYVGTSAQRRLQDALGYRFVEAPTGRTVRCALGR